MEISRTLFIVRSRCLASWNWRKSARRLSEHTNHSEKIDNQSKWRKKEGHPCNSAPQTCGYQNTVRILTFLMLISMPGCYRSFILDLDDIGGFETEYSQESETLRISGLVMHSSYSVKKISTRQIGSDLIVKIKLVHARKGLSGSFDQTLDIPSTVDRVLLGKERKEIWLRSG